MGELSKDQINVDLFDEVKRLVDLFDEVKRLKRIIDKQQKDLDELTERLIKKTKDQTDGMINLFCDIGKFKTISRLMYVFMEDMFNVIKDISRDTNPESQKLKSTIFRKRHEYILKEVQKELRLFI